MGRFGNGKIADFQTPCEQIGTAPKFANELDLKFHTRSKYVCYAGQLVGWPIPLGFLGRIPRAFSYLAAWKAWRDHCEKPGRQGHYKKRFLGVGKKRDF